MGSTATPRLKAGALQHSSRRFLLSGIPAALRPGSLVPNPLVSAGDGPPVRLDTILAGRTAVLTARRPDPALTDFCRRHGLVLVRIASTPGTDTPDGPAGPDNADWTEVRLADGAPSAGMRALTADQGLSVIVRPDRVIAATGTSYRLPQLPWYIPATAETGRPAMAPPLAHPDRADSLPATNPDPAGSLPATS